MVDGVLVVVAFFTFGAPADFLVAPVDLPTTAVFFGAVAVVFFGGMVVSDPLVQAYCRWSGLGSIHSVGRGNSRIVKWSLDHQPRQQLSGFK